jgi:hypothetical protein
VSFRHQAKHSLARAWPGGRSAIEKDAAAGDQLDRSPTVAALKSRAKITGYDISGQRMCRDFLRPFALFYGSGILWNPVRQAAYEVRFMGHF